MRGKLRLDPESLSVTSADTGAADTRAGTVDARMRVTHTDPRTCDASFDWYCSAGDRCTWPAYGC